MSKRILTLLSAITCVALHPLPSEHRRTATTIKGANPIPTLTVRHPRNVHFREYNSGKLWCATTHCGRAAVSPVTVCTVATPTRKLLTGSIVRSADQPGLLHSAGTGNPSLGVGAAVTGGGVLSWRMRIPSILRQGHSAIFHIGIAVVVLIEAFGLVGSIKDFARRLAGCGHVTIVPDLFYRERPHNTAPYDDIATGLGRPSARVAMMTTPMG